VSIPMKANTTPVTMPVTLSNAKPDINAVAAPMSVRINPIIFIVNLLFVIVVKIRMAICRKSVRRGIIYLTSLTHYLIRDVIIAWIRSKLIQTVKMPITILAGIYIIPPFCHLVSYRLPEPDHTLSSAISQDKPTMIATIITDKRTWRC